MSTPTMVYRRASDHSDVAKTVENEHGRWEWQIVEMEDGAAPPDGWHSTPFPFGTDAEEKPKRAKKVKTEESNGDSDGN